MNRLPFFMLACLFSLPVISLDDFEISALRKDPVYRERITNETGLVITQWCHATRLSAIQDVMACVDRMEKEGKIAWVLFYDGEVPSQLEEQR